MSFVISSSVNPTASRAAHRAIGKPVALLARAELRLTRGFISITSIRPSAGFTANWTFDPPQSTPTARRISIAAVRIRWYSRSLSVWIGATVIESPVCTPIGSTFSIEQTMTALSATSRITSSSNSFQPMSDSSMSAVCTGLSSSARPTNSATSSGVCAMLPPRPPSV